MFPLKINERIFSNAGLIVFFILCLGVLPTQSQYTKNCHYSCAYCGSTYYSHCIICQQPFVLTPIKNANNIKQYYNTLQEQPWGPCMGALTQTNALGIVLIIINILALMYFRNRTVFYLVSTLQTLSLFSFIQIAYTSPISYTLQSLEYFMFATSLNRHNRTIKLQIFDDTRYRMWEFLNSYSFKENFTLVFSLSIVCFVIALIIPIARYFSKSQSSLWSICNCVRLQKIFTYLQLGSLITFFFLIQQSIFIISIGLFLDDKFDKDSSNIAMVVIYFIILALMVANMCMKNLQMFTNKIGQQLEILKKCLAPVFVILPKRAIIAVTVFVIILQILAIVFAKLSSKSFKRSYFHECLIRRETKYRIIELIVIVMVIIYYLVETQVQSFQASSAVGVIAVVIISIFFFCVVIQAGIELYGKFYLKQAQQLYQKTGFSLSSLRQSKMLQQTIQNFQTTDQGIMDMVFFGRNRGQQQSTGNHHNLNEQRNHNNKPYKKRSNIHLTLDQLNESIENSNNNMDESHLQRFTPSVSPKHNRQLEKHLKSKTSRTPKNDRTSRFKLNKVSQLQGEQEQRDIQEISMPKASMTREEKNYAQNYTKDEDHSAKGQNQNIAGQKTTQRSFDNVMVKNKNIMREIKTGREINIQVDDGDIQQQQQQQQFVQQKQQIQQPFHEQKSPQFIQQNQQNQPIQQQQQKTNNKKQQPKQSSSKHHIKKPHILNINNSQQSQEQDDLQQLDVHDNLRQVDKTIKLSKDTKKNSTKKNVNNNNNNKKVTNSKKQFS